MAEVKVQSVAEARRKAAEKSNKHFKDWGTATWSAAVLTAYQHGGYEELKANMAMPLKWQKLLIEAYQHAFCEEEFRMARASIAANLKKKDLQEYLDGLVRKLEGKS